MEKNPHKGLKDEVRQFALGFGTGMAILTALALWRGWPTAVWMTSGSLSVWHLGLGFFFTRPLLPSFYLVTTLGKALGHVFFTLVFTLIYFLIYTPVSFLLRLAGKDHIRLAGEKGWKDYQDKDNDPKRIEKLY